MEVNWADMWAVKTGEDNDQDRSQSKLVKAPVTASKVSTKLPSYSCRQTNWSNKWTTEGQEHQKRPAQHGNVTMVRARPNF